MRSIDQQQIANVNTSDPQREAQLLADDLRALVDFTLERA